MPSNTLTQVSLLAEKLNKCQDTNCSTRKQMEREWKKLNKKTTKKCPAATMKMKTYMKCAKGVYDNNKTLVNFDKCMKEKCKKENKAYLSQVRKTMKKSKKTKKGGRGQYKID
jgi:hypothetical protein